MRIRSLPALALLALSALLMTACGGTQVKIANQTGQTLTSVVVSAYPTAAVDSIQYTNVTSGTTTDSADWKDDNYLTVTLTATGTTTYTATPQSIALESGKTNVLTLSTPSGSTVTVTRSTE